jgi:hypothetical protein
VSQPAEVTQTDCISSSLELASVASTAEFVDKNSLKRYSLTNDQQDEEYVANQLVRWRACSSNGSRIDPRKRNRGHQAAREADAAQVWMPRLLSEVHSHNHRENRVRNRVTNVAAGSFRGVYFQTTDQFRSFYGVHMERLAVAVSLKIMSPASAVVGLQAFAHLPTIPLCVGLGLLFVECEESPVAH